MTDEYHVQQIQQEYKQIDKDLDLKNFNTNNVNTMYAMFNKCSSLTSLDLSKFNTENVTDFGFMFNNCYDFNIFIILNFTLLKINCEFLILSFSAFVSFLSFGSVPGISAITLLIF